MGRAAIYPSEHLAEQLKDIGISAAELGRQPKVPTSRITGILNGQRAITGGSVLRLAHFFGTNAKFWLNPRKLYELRIAEHKAGPTIRSFPRLAARLKAQNRGPHPRVA